MYRPILAATAAIAIVAPQPAIAAEIRPYTAEAFAAAQRAGRPIVVDVYADWCTVCRAQKQVMDKLLPRKEFKDLLVFRLNFDEQESDWKHFGVRRQSTLIAFNGRREVARSVAATDQKALHALLRASLR